MVLKLIVKLILGFGLFFACVKHMESKGIYYPVKEVTLYPSAADLDFEEIYLNTIDNVKINGWFIPCASAKYTLLFCHGNAGNIQDRLDKLQLLHQIGLDLFIIDYRGFGKSQAQPSEKGFYLDALAAYDYLVNSRHIAPAQIILYGESLGTAVAIDLASQRKVGALILEGAFSCGRDMAKRMYPFLPKFLFSNIFDSLTKIKKIDAPKLFLHSRSDTTVPFALADKLYRAAQEPKEFIELSGGHNDAFLVSPEKFISSISAFIKGLQTN